MSDVVTTSDLQLHAFEGTPTRGQLVEIPKILLIFRTKFRVIPVAGTFW